ncbi:MAG: hypothetical protein ACJAS1_003629 [Oleiphilaceae bacterium]|jgi:hypothetical protein
MFFFPHIPKAGGTTLKWLFYECFGKDNCLKVWDPNFGADIGANQIENFQKIDFDEVQAVLGHFTVEQFLKIRPLKQRYLDGNVKILATVRDPIDRIISLYNYVCVYKEHPRHSWMLKQDPIEFIKSKPANFQFQYLTENKNGDRCLPNGIEIFSMHDSILMFKSRLEAFSGEKLEVPALMNQFGDFESDFNFFRKDKISSEDMELLTEKHRLDLELVQNCVKI